MKTLTCFNCPVTCCDNLNVKVNRNREGKRLSLIKDPKDFKEGDILEILGITLIKKNNGLWKCKALDPETKKCKIYDYRPYICRTFTCQYCQQSRKNKIDKIKNIENYLELQELNDYTIGLNPVMKEIEKIYYS